MGETGLRLSLAAEYLFEDVHPFLDYGLDLNDMHESEKGVPIFVLDRGQQDYDPTPPKKKEIEDELKRVKMNRYDLVPLRFHGKGTNGHMMYELI